MHLRQQSRGFSLVEVVLALGVVAFSIVAILGMIPAGLKSSRSSQDETRAAQLARMVFASLASGASADFGNVKVKTKDGEEVFVLTADETKSLYGSNDGALISTEAGAAYAISVITKSTPSGFDPGVASEVTVQVGWPATANAANRTKREYIRVISKF